MSPALLVILAILTTAFSFFCEAIFGFGGGLLSIPILSLLIGVRDGVTYILIFQLLMGLLIFQIHRDISWKTALPMTVGLVAGAMFGTFILSAFSDEFLRRFLAAAILIFLVKMVVLPKLTFGKFKGRYWGAIAGAVGGWFQGVIGTGGPVFTMYLAAVVPEKAAFRATLIYLFFATSVVRIFISVPKGLITSHVIALVMPTLPFFLLAIYVGSHLHKRVSEQHYRYAVYVILFVSSISLFIKH